MVKTEKVRTGKSEIWLDEEGFLHLCPVEGADVDLEEVKKCFEVYRAMGFGGKRKVRQLIDARATFSMTSEARDYTAEHGRDFFTAAAVISKSLSIRLIINFFNAFYKGGPPLRMFATEAEALEWLRKQP